MWHPGLLADHLHWMIESASICWISWPPLHKAYSIHLLDTTQTQKKPERVSTDVGEQETNKKTTPIVALKESRKSPGAFSKEASLAFKHLINATHRFSRNQKLFISCCWAKNCLRWIKFLNPCLSPPWDGSGQQKTMAGSLAWVVSIQPPYIIIVLVMRPSRVLYLAVISFKTFQALTPL